MIARPHVHSHLVPCPACGTRFVEVVECPVCGAPDSSYPYWVKILVTEEDESKTLVQTRFCSRFCAVQGVGELHLDFVFKEGMYEATRTIDMTRDRYEALMIRADES